MTRTVAIQALLPNEREAYAVHLPAVAYDDRDALAKGQFLHPACLRCGGRGYARKGRRRLVTADVRDRGTSHRHKEVIAIHAGCIPTDACVPRGIPARSRRVSQVRA